MCFLPDAHREMVGDLLPAVFPNPHDEPALIGAPVRVQLTPPDWRLIAIAGMATAERDKEPDAMFVEFRHHMEWVPGFYPRPLDFQSILTNFKNNSFLFHFVL
jgi:hypothetical protein